MNKIKEILRKIMEIFSSEEVYYVNGADTLPPPLTKQEEEDVFIRLVNNDREARNILIVHNLRLVDYNAKKFESSGVGIEY